MVITERPRGLPSAATSGISREALLVWVRGMAPDLRMRHGLLESGKLAYAARFTFRGEVIEVEAVESDELPDPADAIVRRCAWLLQRRIGIPAAFDRAQRRQLEKQIAEAAQLGKIEEADRLGLELVMRNEGRSPMRGPVPTKFEEHGGSMFAGEKR